MYKSIKIPVKSPEGPSPKIYSVNPNYINHFNVYTDIFVTAYKQRIINHKLYGFNIAITKYIK